MDHPVCTMGGLKEGIIKICVLNVVILKMSSYHWIIPRTPDCRDLESNIDDPVLAVDSTDYLVCPLVNI